MSSSANAVEFERAATRAGVRPLTLTLVHRFRNDLRAALIALGALVGLVSMGRAQVVDQSQLTSDGLRAINSNLTQGQIFTVGRDGFLSAVEVSVGDNALRTAPLSLSIWEGTVRRGYVVIPNEGTSSPPPSLDPDDIVGTLVDLSPFAIEVAVGDVLELRLRCLEQTFFPSVRVATADVYPGGRATIAGNPSTGDLAFKTFVSEDFPPIQDFDQFQPDGVERFYSISSSLSHGQIFAVGRSGKLVAVELAINRSPLQDDELEFVLVDTDSGSELLRHAIAPDDVNIESPPEYLSPSATEGFLVDLSSYGVSVAEGQVLEMQLHTAAAPGQGYAIRSSLVDSYPRGARTNGQGTSSSGDLAFKTFVVVGPVFDDGFESGAVGRWSESAF